MYSLHIILLLQLGSDLTDSEEFLPLDPSQDPIFPPELQVSQRFIFNTKLFYPMALRKAEIVYNFGLYECNKGNQWSRKQDAKC